MAEIPLHSSLLEIFPNSDKELWKKIASQEIDGKEPFDVLSWRSTDGADFFPYYDRDDVIHHHYLQKFRLTVGEDYFLGPRPWWNVPHVVADSATEANNTARDHLTNGADGIFFQLNSSIDLSVLLEKIEWPYCSLFFRTNLAGFFKKNLSMYISKAGFDLNTLKGALFWEECPKKGDVDFYLKKTPLLKSLGLILKPASPVQEITQALTEAVNLIETMKDTDAVSFELFSSIAFSISVDTNFFESIAKLKALRLLWYQVSQAYGLKKYKPSDLHIHAYSSPWTVKEYEPHGNLIKSTTASMASIVGGCDSLTVVPQDQHNRTMNRMARNISSLLREESHFNKVADPIAGSYAVHILIEEIAKQAWELFQSNVKS